MKLFYKASAKEILEARNKTFLEKGLHALKECGFSKSPFLNSWFGRNNLGDYSYQLCRIAPSSHLEMIIVHISKGDSWIKIFLNIFELCSAIESIGQLSQVDGLKFLLPPNSSTKMRLRIDDISGIPILNLLGSQHKIGSYLSRAGLEVRLEELGELIYLDLKNIDYYVKIWHDKYKPFQVDWNGENVST